MPADGVELAKRYLLLTQNLASSVKGDADHQISALFDERDRVLDELSQIQLSDQAKAILQLAVAADAELQTTLGGELEELRSILKARYQEKLAVRTYQLGEASAAIDDSIAC